MAEKDEREPDIPAVFDDSGDEESFDGFERRPDIPKPLDFFVEFVDDNLRDLIVEETNRNACQKLSNSPERLANFVLLRVQRSRHLLE